VAAAKVVVAVTVVVVKVAAVVTAEGNDRFPRTAQAIEVLV
jgi:hypothetical protein